MFIKIKKKAFSFIQSIFTLFLILVVFNLCLIFINYNYSKANTFKTYSDKKTLSYEEEEFLVFINQNIEDCLSLDLKEFEKKKKQNSKFDKYNFEILNNKYYIVKIKNKTKMYIALDKSINGSITRFNPSYYKTDYIVQ